MKAITDGIYYQDVYAGVILGAVILPQGSLFMEIYFANPKPGYPPFNGQP
jgi:hypothetical protein